MVSVLPEEYRTGPQDEMAGEAGNKSDQHG
jgi:hypothetical protein